MYRCLVELVAGKETRTPVYCFKTHMQLPGQYKTLAPKDIIIFEGILCMHDERIRKLFDLKIFIHCDPDIALARRIRRDINERGRDVTEVLKRYNRFVKRDFDKYVKPQMKYVDFTIPGGASNDVAMNILVHNLNSRLGNDETGASVSASLEAQLKAALCADTGKIASSAQLQCLSSAHKHLAHVYLGLLLSDDRDDTSACLDVLVRRLHKSALELIGADFNSEAGALRELGAELYVDGAPQLGVAGDKLKCNVFCATACTDSTVESVLAQHKAHKGLPVYCAFVFIEKEALERLYKEVELLKVVCVFPQRSLASLAEILRARAGAAQFDEICALGDALIADRLHPPHK